jgi:hypothetical protein
MFFYQTKDPSAIKSTLKPSIVWEVLLLKIRRVTIYFCIFSIKPFYEIQMLFIAFTAFPIVKKADTD